MTAAGFPSNSSANQSPALRPTIACCALTEKKGSCPGKNAFPFWHCALDGSLLFLWKWLKDYKEAKVKRTFMKGLQKQEEATWVSNICTVDSSGWVRFYILLAQICMTTQGKRWGKVRQVALNNVHFILIAGCAPFVWSKRSKRNAITISTCSTPLICVAA